MIEDLLDVSRIIVGKLRLNICAVEIAPVLEAALDAIRPMAELKGIQIESKIDATAGVISGDPDRLQQVIWNLLSNAIKFTPENGRVEVALQRTQSHLQIIVSDTGKGMSPEFLPYVFERFRQSNTGLTRSHGGLGLGLSIVRHFIELHAGSVHAHSPGEGKGSKFTIDLPIRAVHLRASEIESDRPPFRQRYKDSRPLEGLSVLIVDDEPDARDLVSAVIERYGGSAITACSASEALNRLETCSLAVMICDIGMPDVDGLSFIKGLRTRPPEHGGRTPAIALTAFNMPEDRDLSLQAGFEMYIAKPVEPAELVSPICHLSGRTSVKVQRQS